MQKIIIFLIFINTYLLGADMKIKLLFNNQELLINLDKNETSKEFYQSLPFELEFSDFIGKEKNSPSTKWIKK